MDNLARQHLSEDQSKISQQSDIFVKRHSLLLHIQHHRVPKINTTQCLRVKNEKPHSDKFLQFKRKLKDYLDKQKNSLSQYIENSQIKRTADNVWHAYKQQKYWPKLKNCSKQETNLQLVKTRMTKSTTEKDKKSKRQFNKSDYFYLKRANSLNLKQYKLKNVLFPKKRSLSQQDYKWRIVSRHKSIQHTNLPINSLYITNLKDKLIIDPNRIECFSRSAELKIKQVRKMRAAFGNGGEDDKSNIFQSNNSQIYICSKELEQKKKDLLRMSKNIQVRKSNSIGMRIQISKKAKTDMGPWSKGGLFLTQQCENEPHLEFGQM